MDPKQSLGPKVAVNREQLLANILCLAFLLGSRLVSVHLPSHGMHAAFYLFTTPTFFNSDHFS
jgi:hypothetical protein